MERPGYGNGFPTYRRKKYGDRLNPRIDMVHPGSHPSAMSALAARITCSAKRRYPWGPDAIASGVVRRRAGRLAA